MTRVNVPLPKPGTEFLLPIGEVTPEEAKALDGYLASAAKAKTGSGARSSRRRLAGPPPR